MAANRKKSCLDEGTGYRVFSVFNTCLLVLILFPTAYPVYFVLIASISDPTKMVANYGLMWLPHFPLSLTSYRMVFRHSLLLSGFGNTLFIVIVGLAFNMVLTVLGAYLLSLKNSLLKKPIAYLILFTMYFSGGIVPGYLNIKSLHLMNTLWALILPGAISTYNMLIMRSAIGALPDALMEAAKLDGASDARVFFQVVLPMSKPILVYTIISSFMVPWTDFVMAKMILNSGVSADWTVAIGLYNMLQKTLINNYFALFCAGGVLVSIPISILFVIMQKFYVEGITSGADKG